MWARLALGLAQKYEPERAAELEGIAEGGASPAAPGGEIRLPGQEERRKEPGRMRRAQENAQKAGQPE